MRWRNRKWLVARLQESVQKSNAQPSEVWNGLDAADAETLANWVDAARDRGAVLFVGAGWTRNADPALRPYDTQVHDEPLPLLWGQLVAEIHSELAHDIGKDGNTDPLWLAELHRQRFGDDALMRLLRRAVPNERLSPGALHHALRAVRWRAILTGNYDTLLEKTFEPFQRVRACIDDADLVRSAERDTVELIHLHGVIDRPDTIVLALEDYRRYPQERPGMLAKVRQLFLQHPVLFVGFGVTDPNFMQWSGWLSDVVGTAKNPWVNLTLDPAPSLSHGRYWGTRLDFVSVPSFPRFRDVVPRVLHVIGEALEDEERSEEVARLRIRYATSPRDVVREVRELLEIGDRSGAEGDDWDRFRVQLFDAAASHVLDLAKEPWREPSSDERAQATRALTLEVDFRTPAQRFPEDREETLRAPLRRAFGGDWTAWCDLLRSLLGEHWLFHRVDLERRRASDMWNSVNVFLGDGDARTGGLAPRASDSSGDPMLDSLRAGNPIPQPARPRTAREFRLAGFLAAQNGQWRLAADHYAAAAKSSRLEFEPLRTEWLTVRSRAISLDSGFFRDPSEDTDAIRAELDGVGDQLRSMRATLAKLSRDARVDAMVDDETEAERKIARQLVDDLARVDVDRTTRLGDKYGGAARWLERLERLYLSPALVRPAADALGTLQWRYGEIGTAALTLARYGSDRLEKLTRALVTNPDVDPKSVSMLIPELLRHGRWPGEWIARAEALVHVLPSCTPEQIEEVGSFILGARGAHLDQSGVVPRGSSSQMPWVARAKIERLEASRWIYLSAGNAVDAIERWLASAAALDAHTITESRALQALDRLPWRVWKESGALDSARIEKIAIGLADARLAKTDPSDTRDLEGVIEFLLTVLWGGCVATSPDSPVKALIDTLAARLPSPRQAAVRARAANATHDEKTLGALADATSTALEATDPNVLNHRA